MLHKPLIEKGSQQHTVLTMGMVWLAVILTEHALISLMQQRTKL